MSRYRICKRAVIDQATFSRFMAGRVGLSLPTLDALAEVLGLDVVARPTAEEITLAPIEMPKTYKRGRKDGEA